MESEFPRRLRRLREEKRPLLSMAVTSELIGLPPSALSKYERGEAEPMAESLSKIADYYHVSMDYLWGRTNY
ncbi:MAG: helix-turn-helix transcriptional regulator [Oscillospiraceae bacterium]|jgi:transcriptional regulator with XRE-family HTH domain|nr:helix-turn-helix transcriptional regulator [Oscillospiraceae bacterium]